MLMQAACAGAGRASTIRTNSRSVARIQIHQVARSMKLFIKYPVYEQGNRLQGPHEVLAAFDSPRHGNWSTPLEAAWFTTKSAL